MFAVLIPVGPGDREITRLGDTLDSLAAHEPPDDVHLVLVDDAMTPRDLRPPGWPSVSVVRTPLWGGRKPPATKSAFVAGVMVGLQAVAATRPRFCLKMDTDALVIAPFAERLERAFADEPRLGMVGSYDVTCTGSIRDWTQKGRVMLNAPNRWHVNRRATRWRIPTGVWYKRRRDRVRARALLDQALANGYVPGAHCLGGAYGVSPALLARTDLLDWRPWIRTWDLGEDVAMGLLCKAAGLEMRSLVGEGEPFALAFRGLPADPEWIVARGHSLIHSVKDHAGSTEEALRAWFRERTRPDRGPRAKAG